MKEHHLEVRKTARYWTAGDPASDDVWVVLHGYKQLARRFLRRFESIAEGRWIVAAEALNRFYVSQEPGRHGPASVVGATWMTREEREIEISDYVAYLDRLADHLDLADRRVTVLGFSQGVATASRWVVHGAVRPERLILWGDVSPPDLDLVAAHAAFGRLDLFVVRGEEDRALAPRLVQEERDRLEGAGIRYELVTYPGGHDIDQEALGALAGSKSAT